MLERFYTSVVGFDVLLKAGSIDLESYSCMHRRAAQSVARDRWEELVFVVRLVGVASKFKSSLLLQLNDV